MLQKLGLAVSHRIRSLIEKMRDKRYRDGYVAAHTRQILAKQMREFRGDLSQTEFAEEMGKRQTVISRLENPSYVGWTLSTMFEIARKQNVAVFVRFVDFPTFLRLSEDMSENALHPRAYDEAHVEEDLNKETKPIIVETSATDEPDEPLTSIWLSAGMTDVLQVNYVQ
jgi:DNA repair exonuclease SbcCD nuclease subunit